MTGLPGSPGGRARAQEAPVQRRLPRGRGAHGRHGTAGRRLGRGGARPRVGRRRPDPQRSRRAGPDGPGTRERPAARPHERRRRPHPTGTVARRGVAGVRVWVGYATRTPDPAGRASSTGPTSSPAGTWPTSPPGSLREWGRPDPDPLLLVCANGRRDRCCGHAGGRLADALWRGPHADRVLTCTHLGGHRFAPTALLLPVGALHGRLDEQARGRPAHGCRGGSHGRRHPAGPQHARPAGPGGRGPRAQRSPGTAGSHPCRSS